jgi:hypothetical protein
VRMVVSFMEAIETSIRKTILLYSCQGCFFCSDLRAFLPQVEANPAEDAHVYVCHPYQSEACDQVPTPIRIQKLETGDDKERCGDIMAEAILAGKQIEKFALVDAPARFALPEAIIAEFPDDFLMRDGPRYGSDGEGNDKQIQHL